MQQVEIDRLKSVAKDLAMESESLKKQLARQDQVQRERLLLEQELIKMKGILDEKSKEMDELQERCHGFEDRCSRSSRPSLALREIQNLPQKLWRKN